MKKVILIFLLLVLLVTPAYATPPVTLNAALIGSNNVTLAATYSANGEIGWFDWGQNNKSMSWKTPNFTSVVGTNNYTIHGSPLNGNTIFWYRACNIEGCGYNKTFTTASVTPMPTTTLGYIFENLTETQFDIMFIPKNLIAPYSDWIEPTGQENSGVILSIVFGMIFFALFAGMWMSGRSTFVPGMVGLIASGLLWGTGGAGGLGILIAPEFVAAAQGIMVASFAGVIMGMIKR